MGKSKKPRIANFHHHDRPKSRSSSTAITPGAGAGAGGPRKMKSFSRVSTSTAVSKGGQGGGSAKGKTYRETKHANAQRRAPTIPFQKEDRILLVGEGDFSFALSLATHHDCKNLLATSYDSEQALYEKHPQAKRHIEKLYACGSEISSSQPRSLKRKSDENEDFEDGGSGSEKGKELEAREEGQNLKNENIEKPSETQHARNHVPKVLFSIDARKLGSGPAGGGKTVRNGFPRTTTFSSCKSRRHHPWKDIVGSPQQQNHQQHTGRGGPWDIICFNFPHVGGLSTDVNRQVRANQELVVAFFKASGTDNNTGTGEKSPFRTTPGQILVSLFEGEPYTLWNIRDLARHAGLRVVTSFRFPWASYPGYSHARTIGEIEKRNGGTGRGGWRGEDREARMYVFEKGTGGVGECGGAEGKKRKKGGKGRGGANTDDDSD
ncbi:conserved hypothetical protein [Histoplasma capsulatum var. duboisii H88]|uniref:25S rRNA (uridine-N(3))-methyltransferase BMT5-like domain-containing protein n=2 Tax=Ajellomyces capsulatus TaxID=5037 RepID=F0UG81_AJEC8|nr:conserved hypothetical protein [Histoplasma capsulatum H143]EGC45076.1 conserved hypothetical protein [Histoplasma capsulatum var. duboisii H88]